MSKCWYCNEELTTANYCDEHIGICTKCYALMFKVGNEFVKGLTDKIADLEAKLAELNKEPLNCSQLETGMSLCIIQKSEIAQLKQQLEEKEKNNKLLEAMISTLPEHDKELEEIHNQDEISFCIEKLTESKQRILQYLYNMYDGINVIDKEDLDYIFNNQIEELKKEMK